MVFKVGFIKIIKSWKLPLEQFPQSKQWCWCKNTVFLNCFRKSCAGISCSLHSFLEIRVSLKIQFEFEKVIFHKSFSSRKILKLLCFTKNVIWTLTGSYLELKLTGPFQSLGRPGSGFCKNEGLWSLIFETCPCCPLGKSLIYNFRVTLCLIRPLRASKSDYQKTGQFHPKTGSLFLGWFYVLIRAPYLNRPQREPNFSHAVFLTFQSIITYP